MGYVRAMRVISIRPCVRVNIGVEVEMFRKEYYLMAPQRACLVVVIEAELAL